MNTPNADGAISLKESMLEVEGWTPEIYQRNFNDFLDSQPYLVGTLMDADDDVQRPAAGANNGCVGRTSSIKLDRTLLSAKDGHD